MEEENKSLVKIVIAILAQAVIDAYIGSRSMKKKSREWFRSDEFKVVANLLRQNGIKPQNLFDLPCSWDEIQELSTKRGEILYIKCKAVNYLEGTNENRYMLGTADGKGLIKVSTRKKLKEGLQLVNPSML